MPYQTVGASVVITMQASTTSVITTSYVTMMAIGRNVVTVQFIYSHYDQPPAHSLQKLDATTTHVLHAIVQDLAKG
jgi:hypothetical protein